MPPDSTQLVPSYIFSASTPTVVSYHVCPSTGLAGGLLFAKFSKICRKLLAIASPYAVLFLPGKDKLVSVLFISLSSTIIDPLLIESVNWI